MLHSFAEVPRIKKSQYEQRILALGNNNSQLAFPELAQLALPSQAPAPMSSNKKGKGKGKKSGKNQTQARPPISSELFVSGVSEVQPDDEGYKFRAQVHRLQQRGRPIR